MREEKLRLEDIINAIEKIEKKIKSGKEEVFANGDLVDSIFFNFIIIGEAAANLSPAIKDLDKSIPWVDIISLRNLIVHHYFDIVDEVIWDTMVNDLAELKTKIVKILDILD